MCCARPATTRAGWWGAISPSLPDTGHWGVAPEVVLEGDEYIVGPADRRSKFVLYHPRDVLLTSLVHDHVNVFPTFADYEAPFRELLRLIPAEGLLVARESPAIRAVAGEAACRVVWYDTAPCEGWWAEGVVYGDVTRFVLVRPDGGRIALSTSLLGAHNIENIVGVAAYLLERGLVGEAALKSGVASFAGIRRRLDRLTAGSAVPVIEGFGSSYEKARSAIEALLLHYSAPAADGGLRAAHLLLAQPRCAGLVRHRVRGRGAGADRPASGPRGGQPPPVELRGDSGAHRGHRHSRARRADGRPGHRRAQHAKRRRGGPAAVVRAAARPAGPPCRRCSTTSMAHRPPPSPRLNIQSTDCRFNIFRHSRAYPGNDEKEGAGCDRVISLGPKSHPSD